VVHPRRVMPRTARVWMISRMIGKRRKQRRRRFTGTAEAALHRTIAAAWVARHFWRGWRAAR
jgi:hypothetical protein